MSGEDPADVAEAMFELDVEAAIDAWFCTTFAPSQDEVTIDILTSIVVNLPLAGAAAALHAAGERWTGQNGEIVRQAICELDRLT